MPSCYERPHTSWGSGRKPNIQCSFNVPDEELISFADKSWCKFHLPMELDGVPSPKMNWSPEVGTQFRNDVLSRVVTPGHARGNDFSGLVCPIDIDFFARGPRKQIDDADFFGSQFLGVTSFSKIKFGRQTNFSRVKCAAANFQECNFFSGADFNGASFDPEPFLAATRNLFSVFEGLPAAEEGCCDGARRPCCP